MFNSNRAKEAKKPVFLTPESEIRGPSLFHIKMIHFILLALLCIGLTNLYSATNGGGYFFSQVKNLTITLSAFVIFAWLIPLRNVAHYSYWFLTLICISLFAVLMTGRIAGGSQRWLHFGPIGFQPSEFAKLAVILTVAKFFSQNRQQSAYRLRDLWPLLAVLIAVFALIFVQPDLGTAGVCLIVAVCQIAFVRIDWKSLGIVIGSLPVIGLIGWNFLLHDYQKLRVLNLLNPALDPKNTGWNSNQSIIAVGSGKIYGKGFMQGTQTHLRFLPERHTDFAFSVFGEEQGFLGCVFVLILFSLLSYFALEIARQSKDTYSGMLAIGIAAFLFFEFGINAAMVIGVFPVVGIPMPFFSFGSSLLLTICVSLGLLVSISRANHMRLKS